MSLFAHFPIVSHRPRNPLVQSINEYTAHLGKLSRSVFALHLVHITTVESVIPIKGLLDAHADLSPESPLCIREMSFFGL